MSRGGGNDETRWWNGDNDDVLVCSCRWLSRWRNSAACKWMEVGGSRNAAVTQSTGAEKMNRVSMDFGIAMAWHGGGNLTTTMLMKMWLGEGHRGQG